MFIPFYYALRSSDIKPSMGQWMALMKAIEMKLAAASLTGFYHLCRHILLTTEADFDRFDEVFFDFFRQIRKQTPYYEEIPAPMMEWLIPAANTVDDAVFFSPEHMEILKRLEEAILRILKSLEAAVQAGETIGNCAVCTGCGLCTRYQKELPETEIRSAFWSRKETEERFKSALDLAEERHFRDFREDTLLDIRQFQLAFRKLRQYSANLDVPETELDLDKTIENTARNAGSLRITYRRPRKNTLKLLVLFDSDGSMWQHAEVSNRLFQAANKANHFKELTFYYFHNCIYDHLYTDPRCKNGEWESTDHILHNLDQDTRVIIIGDASMADSELFSIGGNVLLERSNKSPGIYWLNKLRRLYPKSVWLNPIRSANWNRLYGGRTIQAVKRIFPMYELTVKGLEDAVKKLLMAR
jgi:uncharacterized protein with von Willebrand factor type A (vWA) domain